MNFHWSKVGIAAALVLAGVGAMVGTAGAQPASVQVGGSWSTQFAGAAANVGLTQSGNNVVGTYVNSPPLLPGGMAGVLRGNVLTGRWTDATSSGGFALAFSPDGRSFVGTWGRSVASNTNGGPWIGQRR